MRLDDLVPQLKTFSEREAAAPEEYPAKDIDDLFNLGLIAGPLPKALGGSDLSCDESVACTIELAAAVPSTALLAIMPMGLAAATTAASVAAPAEHKKTATDQLERIAADFKKKRFYAACNSERGAAGALAQMKTVAKKDKEGVFHLSGDKILASGGKNAAVFFSGASVNKDDLPSGAAVEFFLVESASPGVQVMNDWDGLGMRSTESHSVRYTDAPAREMLGFPRFMEIAQPWVWSFCQFAAIPIGCAWGILKEVAIPAPTSPALRARFADAQMRIEAARAYLTETARGWQPASSGAWRSKVVRAKTYVAQDMTRLASDLFALGGGRHYRRGSKVARLLQASYAGTGLRPPLPLALDMLNDGFSLE